jgi:hypothetical protein
MKLQDLFSGVWSGKPLKLLNVYSAKDTTIAVSDKKPTAQTVTIRNGQTGEITGKRTIYQK